jgi:hypothetical protein
VHLQHLILREQLRQLKKFNEQIKEKVKKNPTLVKNMPNVKWDQIPPLKGPDPDGIKAPLQQPKRFKTILTVSNKKS